MRDAINRDEEDRLVRAVQSGLSWDEVRGLIQGVDPEALDRGFRDQVLRKAGVLLEEPRQEALPELPSAPPVRRKGKG